MTLRNFYNHVPRSSRLHARKFTEAVVKLWDNMRWSEDLLSLAEKVEGRRKAGVHSCCGIHSTRQTDPRSPGSVCGRMGIPIPFPAAAKHVFVGFVCVAPARALTCTHPYTHVHIFTQACSIVCFTHAHVRVYV